ncbi:DUF2961 domain-containing protein [Dactylosporangium sp. CA-092794]|uniref:DUF2961 domain-containing protein n=1 Tax=Dactylosporangium sp. CA-092794 TaxID=3239929 RepID=UPI003D918601
MSRRASWIVSLIITAALLTAAPSAAHAGSAEPHGLDALEQLDRLPYLDSQARSGMESTYGRDGTYSDHDGYLYEDATDRVFADLRGPGEITRIWSTALDPADEIHIYLDGESTPRVSMAALDFFNGTNAPFRGPLVLNADQSSGGWVSYLPMQFAQSVRVALRKRAGIAAYLQVNYQQYSAGTPVTTWTSAETGGQDSTDVRNLWNAAGTDPKPPAATTTVSGTVTAPAAGSTTLLDVAGPRSISSIRLKLPAITSTSTAVTDDGRAFGAGGSSQFTVAVDAASSGVTLTRRLDYGVADQQANVYVDGALAGVWFDQDGASGSVYDQYVHWKDSTFAIPPALTAGKSRITVRIAFISSAIDWNEFTYWVRSTVGGTSALTDTVDVFNAASEAAHAYSINGSSWAGGSRTFYYPYDDGIAALLNQLSLRITWDGAASPAVNAPLGSLFAAGNYGFTRAPRTLMAGIDASNWLYLYFPMPFASHATVVLANAGAAVTGVQYEIKHKTQAGSFDNVGYFTTEYRSQTVPASFNHDVDLIDRDGQGAVVGLVMSARGAPNTPAVSRSYPEGYPPLGAYQVGYFGHVEGDEKFYVDGNLTPAHGTGVEDFANAGFAWNHGFLATPTHGYSSYRASRVDATNWVNRMAFHRILLADRVNFTSHVRLSLEHGLVNDFGIDDLSTLVYYYYKPTLRTVRTDVLDVGAAASETAHGYTTSGTVTAATRTQSFEGDYRDVFYTDDGKAVGGYSQFTLAINPANNGVLLRDRFDQTYLVQEAAVSVDGAAVGTWRAIGGNPSQSRFKETDFLIPAGYTAGKSSITVRLTRTASSDPLSQYRISAHTILTGAGAPLPPAPGQTVTIANPDFESGTLAGWTATGTAFTNNQVVTQTVQNGVPFAHHGTYHYWGYGGGATDTPTGTMRTPSFLLGGDGKLRFLIGGGNDIAALNLALVRAADDRVLLSATGRSYEGDKTVVMDAGEWVGTTVYLKATDAATGGWGHLNLDDFHVPLSTFTNNLTGTWTSVGGTWTDVAGGLRGTSGPDAWRLNSQTAAGATVEADIRLTTPGAGALIVRANASATQFYAANIDSVNQRVLFWGPGVAGRSQPASIALNTTYHLKVVASGSHIQVYFSGYSGGTAPILDFTDTTLASGQIGLNVWTGSATFQNLTVS